MRGAVIPAEGEVRMQGLTFADVVDLSLGNSPVTRATWAQARAAAATLGSARGHYLPTIDAEVTGGPSKIVSSNPARAPAERNAVTPSLSLQYLLFDFGARGGTTRAAREALYAGDLAHNAAVQSVVLLAEQAYFSYQASRGLFAAAQAAVQTAESNLSAAERRHEVGLATIADVLQARTALAQAKLAAQSAEGNVQASRADVALAMGLDANGPFEVAADSGATPALSLTESVDSLIERAVRDRPDVAAARALVRQSEAEVRVAQSATLPNLALGATTGRSFSNISALEGRTYALTLGLSVPLFSGLSRQYDVVAARENAAAVAARAEQTRLQAVAQVFASYYTLRTATQRVATSGELLASAQRSEEVARGRYAEGVGSILDVLTAQSALADARAQSVQARWAWYSSLAQLARDAGVLGPRGEARLPFTSDTSGGPRR
jgi:outer membrane protein TolC